MKKIILDTNFLIIPFQFGVDIYSELERIVDEKHELYILKAEIPELLNLKFGKAAYELAMKKNVKVVEFKVKNGIDATILAFAKKEDAIIATQDKKLKREAKEDGLQVITMRQKKYLILM